MNLVQELFMELVHESFSGVVFGQGTRGKGKWCLRRWRGLKKDGQTLRKQLGEMHLRSWTVHELFMSCSWKGRPKSPTLLQLFGIVNQLIMAWGWEGVGDCGVKRVLRSWGAWWKTNSKKTSERETFPFMNCSWTVHETVGPTKNEQKQYLGGSGKPKMNRNNI